MDATLVNKVANSGLITIDLETFLPSKEVVGFDLKDHLFMGLILKEKDFREALKSLDTSLYKDKNVAIYCSTGAIIPVWAYMLLVSYLQPVTENIYIGTIEEMEKHLFLKNIESINTTEYNDKKVVIKGCGDKPIGNFAYAEITRILLPVVKSIMYGEPCSTVPVYKKKSNS